jgi:hypothetical protein
MKKFSISIFLLLIVSVCFLPKLADAHLNSMSFSKIEVKENEVRWEMKFTLLCTLELFAVDVNNDNFLQEDELKSAWSMMYYYLSNKIKVLSEGKQLRMVLKDITFSVEEDDSYTVFDLSFPFRQDPKGFLFLCNVQEETDPYHQGMAEIHLKDASYAFVFSNVNYFDSINIPRFARKFNPEDLKNGAEKKESTLTEEKKDDANKEEEEEKEN